MIEQTARVVEIDSNWIVVATESQSGCNSCNVKSGCGTSLLGQLFPNRPAQQLRLATADLDTAPRVGDRVVIGIDEAFLQQSTLLLYLVPLLGLLLGAIAGVPIGGEPMSILLGLLGLSVGLLMTRQSADRRSKRLANAVKVLRVQPAGGVVGIADLVTQHKSSKPTN